MTDTFLPPIERPRGILMKLAYAFVRRKFGKVLTPVKVHSVRLPTRFARFYVKVGKLDAALELPQELALLIRLQVSRINLCSFCIDISRWAMIETTGNEAKLDALEQFATSPLFTEAERAALDYATELTKERKVDPGTFARMARHFSERQICEIVWLVASEHLFNMTNIGLNIHSDMLCRVGASRPG